MTWFKSPGFYTSLDFHSFFFLSQISSSSRIYVEKLYCSFDCSMITPLFRAAWTQTQPGLSVERAAGVGYHHYPWRGVWPLCDITKGLVSSGSSSAHSPSIRCAWAQDEDVFWTPNANLLPSFPVDATNGWLSVASEPWQTPVIFFLTTFGRRLPPPERRLDVFFLSAASFYVALQLGTLAQPAAAKAH